MDKALRIWLVDDDANDQFLVSRVLQKISLPVVLTVFDQPQAAISMLEAAQSDRAPDLVICDLKMAGMDGFEFLSWIRHSLWKATPLIICSNSSVAADVNRAYALGANAYHTKASNFQAMHRCFDALTKYWGKTISLPPASLSERTSVRFG